MSLIKANYVNFQRVPKFSKDLFFMLPHVQKIVVQKASIYRSIGFHLGKFFSMCLSRKMALRDSKRFDNEGVAILTACGYNDFNTRYTNSKIDCLKLVNSYHYLQGCWQCEKRLLEIKPNILCIFTAVILVNIYG